MGAFKYILLSTSCLSFGYLIYLLVSRNENNFKQLRLFLLCNIFLALVIPLSKFSLDINFADIQKFIPQSKIETANEKELFDGKVPLMDLNKKPETFVETNNKPGKVNWPGLVKKVYYFTAFLLILRIIIQVLKLYGYYFGAEKEIHGKNKLVYSKNMKHAFSFFSWIFIPNKNALKDDEKEKIIAHEKIHVSQYHSIDILLIELLAAVMWFNPLVWMMRNSIQLVHEYLADEGALGTGIDKLKYQALLLNQVAEERLICLSSSFNHSLIKKRMIMMTNNKISTKSKSKIFTLIPISIMLFLFVACINGILTPKAQASPAYNNEQWVAGKGIVQNNMGNPDSLNNNEENSEFITTVYAPEKDTIKVNKKSANSVKKVKTVGYSNGVKINGNVDAMYIVDDKKVSDINNINPDSIKSIEVIRNRDLIILNTKEKEEVKVSIRKVKGENNSVKPILYIVDGKPCTKEEFSQIEPSSIKEISVLKDEGVMKKYTNSNEYDGVILITTKSTSDPNIL